MMTLSEYVEEVLEEYTEVAIEYGRNPTPENELALCEASELMYKALELKENSIYKPQPKVQNVKRN